MQETLQAIYGMDAAGQATRYAAALDRFAATYGPGAGWVFRAPGRVNLIGEHTDYNHGFVLPVALDRDILLVARPRLDNLVRLANSEAVFPAFAFQISENIPAGPPGSWENYAKGAAQELARQLQKPVRGLDGFVAGQAPRGVPRGAGLSSSSALTVVCTLALAHFNGWQPERVTLARHCSEAEWYVGTRGGIMDQFISLLARRDHALFLDCRPDATGQYPMEHIPLPVGYHLLVVDSKVRHQNVRGAFNRRVAACRAGVGLLRAHYPHITHLRDVQQVPWAALEPHLPESITVRQLQAQGIELGDIPGIAPDDELKVRARCRHVWTENQRVLTAVAAMRAGDVGSLGELLQAAHTSARDDYEVSCPELDLLVAALMEMPGVLGARLTGAGWGGCVIALVEEPAVEDVSRRIQARYHEATQLNADVYVCRAGLAAGLVGEYTVSK